MERDDEIAALKERLAKLESTPGVSAPPPPANKKSPFGCLAWVAGFILLALVVSMCSDPDGIGPVKNDPAEPASVGECDNEFGAYIMMQTFVERQLKAPSTARFPSSRDSQVAITKSGECSFTVVGYVDAQNSFGAMIRTRYIGEIEAPASGDTYTLKSLQLLE